VRSWKIDKSMVCLDETGQAPPRTLPCCGLDADQMIHMFDDEGVFECASCGATFDEWDLDEWMYGNRAPDAPVRP